jgi:hypothetical protein
VWIDLIGQVVKRDPLLAISVSSSLLGGYDEPQLDSFVSQVLKRDIHSATFAQHATDLSENTPLSMMVPWLMFEQ